MRVLVQRVSEARVTVAERVIGEIDRMKVERKAATAKQDRQPSGLHTFKGMNLPTF